MITQLSHVYGLTITELSQSIAGMLNGNLFIRD